MAYVPYSKEQKLKFSKQFNKQQLVSYRKGKRYGFLIGIHKKNKINKQPNKHNYSNEELNNLYHKF